jgi:uncharacterized protein (DUF1684 family)
MKRETTASVRCLLIVAALALAACSRDRWPEPPAVDRAAYQKEFDAWRLEQRQSISDSLPIVGIWPIDEGETPFGTEASLPIALPASAGAARAGVFRRVGETITVVPTAGVPLRWSDGTPLTEASELSDAVTLGAIEIFRAGGADGRLFVMARDLEHPAAKMPPPADVFDLDPKWRVSARFDAFATPKLMKIADVRGGMSEMPAVGELVFPLDGRERRLVVFEGGEEFFLMFKDATNGSTTYGGYRILAPKAVESGEFTVIDFNFAYNPPCAYSSFTTCPLPPRENTLDVAVEAGLKQLPSVKGWSG